VVVKLANTVRVGIGEQKVYDASIYEDWDVLQPKEAQTPKTSTPND
jgi:hypothetical protein